MDRGVENKQVVTKSENFRGFPMVGVKYEKVMGNNTNRRALRDINNRTNNVSNRPGKTAPYPAASFKGVSTNVTERIEEKEKGLIGHRPITRRFAASLARNPHDCLQNNNIRCKPNGIEAQRISQSVQDMSFVETVEVVNVDEIAFPEPMVEEIEEMIDGDLKEVEMEDLEAKILTEIDSGDSRNPLAVVSYVNEIYSFYRDTEELSCVPSNYMSNQLDINDRMRAVLIDWLIEVHYKFDLVEESLFLTVNIIDRFLSRHSVPRKKLQLVGVTAMLLACKYEEVIVPVVEDLIVITDRAYSREEVLHMESLIVNIIQYNMSVPTPYVFMRRFLKASQSDKKLELLSSYITELCLVEYEMLKYRPSMLAAAAVYTAQCSLRGFKHWTRTSELCTRYSELQLLECSRMMVGFHQKSGKGRLIGVHKKYSTFKYGCAAKSEPALFLLDSNI